MPGGSIAGSWPAGAAKAFLKQVMIDGCFHGDPHPGNLLVQPDGTLAFIDFGVVGRLDELTMARLAEVFLGFVHWMPTG